MHHLVGLVICHSNELHQSEEPQIEVYTKLIIITDLPRQVPCHLYFNHYLIIST
jgi:hypothetical protein